MPERADYTVIFPGLKTVSRVSFQVGYGKGLGILRWLGSQEEEGAFKPPLLGLPCKTSRNYLFFGVFQYDIQAAPAVLAP